MLRMFKGLQLGSTLINVTEVSLMRCAMIKNSDLQIPTLLQHDVVDYLYIF